MLKKGISQVLLTCIIILFQMSLKVGIISAKKCKYYDFQKIYDLWVRYVLHIDNLISAMESGFGVGILISKAD